MRTIRRATIIPAVVMALILSSCGTNAVSREGASRSALSTIIASGDAPGGPAHTIEVDEPYANVSLAQLGHVSDLAVQARVIDIAHGITLGVDRSMSYRQYTIERTGESGPDSARVFVAEKINGQPIVFENQPTLSQGDEAIWVLDRIEKEFNTPGFVLTASNSIFPIKNTTIDVSHAFPAGEEASALLPAELLSQLGSS